MPRTQSGDIDDAARTALPDELLDLLSAPVNARTLEHRDPSVIATTVHDAELVFVGSDDMDVIHQIDDEDPDELWSEDERGIVITRSRGATRSSPFGWVLNRIIS